MAKKNNPGVEAESSSTKEEQPEQRQQNLFGEDDAVYNALHGEMTVVNKELEKVDNSFENLEKKQAALTKRRNILQRGLEDYEKKMIEVIKKK